MFYINFLYNLKKGKNMAVMIAVRDETNETIENIIKKRLEADGVKDSKARVVAEAVKKLEAEVTGKKDG